MAKRLLSKSDFARIAGVAASTITRAAKTSLRPAMVFDRVDADHPAALAFIQRQKQRKGRP